MIALFVAISFSRSALWLNLPGLTALLTICSLCGFVVYAQYRNCDPLTRPNPIKKDQVKTLICCAVVCIDVMTFVALTPSATRVMIKK